MRIMLTTAGLVMSDQLRAYTEYRLFTSIARFGSFVRGVGVTLRREPDAFLCAVVIDLESSGQLKTRGRAPHPSAAVDKAAQRTAALLARRAPQPVSS
jgi:ribosome-associated translation inhibitor RaiA